MAWGRGRDPIHHICRVIISMKSDIASVKQGTRIYAWLEGLRWLPLGLAGPVFVLRPVANGVSLDQVGIVFVMYSLATVVFELPTGGLADVIGRRTTLMLFGLLQMGFQIGFLIADSVLAFALAAAVGGVARALGSGPLEAWYVDSVNAVGQEHSDLRKGLSVGVAAAGIGVGIGASSVAAMSFLSELFGWQLDILAMPFLIGLGVSAVWLIAIAWLVTDRGRTVNRTSKDLIGSWQEQARGVVAVVTLVLKGASARSMTAILIVATAAGVGLAGIEVLYQPRIQAIVGGTGPAVVTTGVLVALIGLSTALGSSMSGRVTEHIVKKTKTGAALFQVLAAITILGLAVSQSIFMIAFAFLAFYFFSGAGSPLIREMLHTVTSSDVRTANISLLSLSTHVGSIGAGLVLPVLASNASIPTAWAVAALITGLGAIALLAYNARSEPQDSSESNDL